MIDTRIFLARYDDSMYSEDNVIFGAYTTREKAQDRIESECRYYQHQPSMHKAKIHYYSVEEVEVVE